MVIVAKKKPTAGKLKKKLWKVFALYNKLIRSTDGWVDCYTCDAGIEIGTSNCQMGHYYPKGGYGYLYFHEDNVRPQCYHCNINLSGNSAIFVRRLLEEIGAERLDYLYDHRKVSEKRGVSWYQEKIDHYTRLVRDMEMMK